MTLEICYSGITIIVVNSTKDVYKRQGLHLVAIVIFPGREGDSPSNQQTVEVIARVPVSYTHLDVYKRQVGTQQT